MYTKHVVAHPYTTYHQVATHHTVSTPYTTYKAHTYTTPHTAYTTHYKTNSYTAQEKCNSYEHVYYERSYSKPSSGYRRLGAAATPVEHRTINHFVGDADYGASPACPSTFTS